MSNTTSHYEERVAVFNPGRVSIFLSVYALTGSGSRIAELIEVPGNCWRFIPNNEDALNQARDKGLRLISESSGTPPIDNGSTPTYDPEADGQDLFEDFITLSAQHMSDGYFELERKVQSYHWDSLAFVPVGGTTQVYGHDFTCVNTSSHTRVIFNSTIANGPTHGLQNILSVGDRVSVRYMPK